MKRFVSKAARLSFALMLGLVIHSSAEADLEIQFSVDEGASFDTAIELAEGDSANIQIYFTDSEITGPVSTNGLEAFELLVEADTAFLSITGAALQLPYEQVAMVPPAVSSDSFVWDAFGFSGTPIGDRILLGSFDIVANAAGQTVFTAGDNDLAEDDWLAGSGGGSTPLDQTIFGPGGSGSFSFTVTAVPEPSSILVGLSLIAFGASRRRKS